MAFYELQINILSVAHGYGDNVTGKWGLIVLWVLGEQVVSWGCVG